jgi:hypothetical protein
MKHCVVPAQAGTHDHGPSETAEDVVMGPGYPLRGFWDDHRYSAQVRKPAMTSRRSGVKKLR